MEADRGRRPRPRPGRGWLNRLVGELPGTSPLQGIGVGNQAPTSLFGADRPSRSAASTRPRSPVPKRRRPPAGVPGSHAWRRQRPDGPRGARRDLGGAETFGAARDPPAGAPATATPPAARQALSDVSRIVRSGVGAEVITVDQGDWDMHTDVGTLEWGDMKRNASDLAALDRGVLLRPRPGRRRSPW